MSFLDAPLATENGWIDPDRKRALVYRYLGGRGHAWDTVMGEKQGH